MNCNTQGYQVLSYSRDPLTIHNLRFCNSLFKMKEEKTLKALTVIHPIGSDSKEDMQHGF